ncbi:hypothetical protein AKJ51_04995 [candidate division MSBL1 archaeon SCGC-AAA382A20]|uniref:Nucleotidyl transferase AbiEii/AbiGii toxin family protein n=1 Tax=candidate division MSBL1 archaeon SCGC-AAA382A20 TaxID=1698280 RepID=A0A133VGC9_9EURY|nr:hypothetical protein AKJ51_04995 [candidate division MSBL1 archaeon SCGC-AAA382A20]
MEGKSMKGDEIKRLAGRKNIPIGTINKDYVLTVVLKQISDLPYSNKLIFKGGTCIKKVYFEDARFSVDLDFTCLESLSDKILEDLKEKLGKQEVLDINFMELRKEERGGDSARHGVKYKDVNGHPNSIKLDLNSGADVKRDPVMRKVLNPYYQEIPDFEVRALPLKEILAEKIRAVITRGAPRDVYDIWYLLGKGVEVDMELVDEKLGTLKKDNEFDWEMFRERMLSKQENWNRDLRTLVPEAPKFEQVRSEMESMMLNQLES